MHRYQDLLEVHTKVQALGFEVWPIDIAVGSSPVGMKGGGGDRCVQGLGFEGACW